MVRSAYSIRSACSKWKNRSKACFVTSQQLVPVDFFLFLFLRIFGFFPPVNISRRKMAMKNLVEGECGAANALVRVTDHFNQQSEQRVSINMLTTFMCVVFINCVTLHSELCRNEMAIISSQRNKFLIQRVSK